MLLDLLYFLQHLHRLYELTFGTKPDVAGILAAIEETPVLGPPSEAARAMAAEHVPLAKAEALMMLGEQSAATRVVEEWLRSTGV